MVRSILRNFLLSTCLLGLLASCEEPEEVGPIYKVKEEEKGAPAVNSDAGWEQVSNFGFIGSGNQWKFIGLSERNGYVMAAIQSSFASQQGVVFTPSVGYIDAEGFFRATAQTPGSYGFRYDKPEPGADYSLSPSNYFQQGRPLSLLIYSRSTAGNVFYRVTHYGQKVNQLDIGYGTFYGQAYCAMPYSGPNSIISPGNTGYYAYTWLVGAPVQRILEFGFTAVSYDVPVTYTQGQDLFATLVPENEQKLHMVYIRTTRGGGAELIHFTKNLNAAPVLVGTVPATLPDSAAYDLFYQAGKLVVCGRVGNRAVFVDATTGASLADVTVQRNTNNSPLVSAALMPDGTPVIGFSDATAGDKLTVLKCIGNTGSPLGKVGLTNGTTGCLLKTLNGALYAGIVNQEARSLAIIKLKQ
jgi:hypothetical protein